MGGIVLADGAVEAGDVSTYDPAITAGFIAARSDLGTVMAQALTFFGSTAALLPLTVALLAFLAWQRRWAMAGAVATGMSLSLALTVLLKGAIARVRPPTPDVLGPVNHGFAFPSGHTLNGTVFFALLAAALFRYCRSRWSQVAVVSAGAAMAVGIGMSRVYLGYHWLTDVLAGWSFAIAVLGVVMVGSALLEHRQSRRITPPSGTRDVPSKA